MAEQAKPWITYLARSSFMLQQGKFVADIIYYYGEDNNITALFGENFRIYLLDSIMILSTVTLC